MSCLNPDPPAVPPAGDARFVQTGIPADAVGAAQTRIELGEWLQQHFSLGGERLNNVVLTAYEALANPAEFAYLDPKHRHDATVCRLRFRFGQPDCDHQRPREMAPARRYFATRRSPL